MHNIDVVQRILEYFLMHEHEHEHEQQQQQKSRKMVSKLLDHYLAEVAKDPNLSVTKFQALAEALPVKARTCHDGIYRAIDTYLKVLYKLPLSFFRLFCFGFFQAKFVKPNFLIFPIVSSILIRK